MKRIQIQKALLFSLLFSSWLYADTIDRIEYKLGRIMKDVGGLIVNGNTVGCTPITQNDITNGSGVYTIIESGAYCVTENLTGNIIIGVNSVCIDLQCYNVSAGSGANAFTITGQNGIRISNGSISNSTVAGILAVGCNAVELSNLYFVNNANDAIRLNGCTEVYVNNVNINGGTGVRALGLLDCSQVVVENSQMAEYSASTGTGILEIISGSGVVVKNVELSNNFFLSSAAASNIHLLNSSDVLIKNSYANFAGTLSSFPAHGILIDSCANCLIVESQVNGNVANGIEIVGTYDEEACIAIRECIAMDNGGIGFNINPSAVMAASICLMQNCVAMSNSTLGFASSPALFQTVMLGNLAQNNGNGTTLNNFSIFGGIISLYELSRSTGLMTNISGQPTISPWTNMSVVPV